MARGEAVAPPGDAPMVEEPVAGSAPAGSPALTMTQDQFRELLDAVRPAVYVEPELDLENDPAVWTWARVKVMLDAGEIKAMTFVPDQSVMIGWNCLYVWVCAGEENVVPEMHYDVYVNSRTSQRRGEEEVRNTLLKRVGSDGGKPFASFSTGWNGNSNEL